MPKNSFTFDGKTGSMKAVSNLQVSFEYTCECGLKSSGTMEWPEGLTTTGTVSVGAAKCPQCLQPVVLPKAEYWAEDFQLKSKPAP